MAPIFHFSTWSPKFSPTGIISHLPTITNGEFSKSLLLLLTISSIKEENYNKADFCGQRGFWGSVHFRQEFCHWVTHLYLRQKSNKVLSINKKLQILRTSTDCDDIRKQVLTIILANHFELALPLLATISGKVGLTVTMFRNFTSE